MAEVDYTFTFHPAVEMMVCLPGWAVRKLNADGNSAAALHRSAARVGGVQSVVELV
jgi:hypothetical protein